MIAFLKGLLDSRREVDCIVDVNGVGYEVSMPASDMDRLPPAGEPVTIYTWHLQREDGAVLFGFLNSGDRRLFKVLLGVTGIGPKAALAVLSGLSQSQLEQAVLQQDVNALSRLPGIGRKTAERLLWELKDKLKISQWESPRVTGHEREDYSEALEALIALGYPAVAARGALQKVVDQELPPREEGKDRVAELVRRGLKHC